MIDQTVAKLVQDVREGNLRNAAALLDRLAETNDPRYRRLCRLLYGMQEQVTATVVEQGRRRGGTAESRAYRISEARFYAWAQFTREMEVLFHVEIHGVMDVAGLAKLEMLVEAPRQAQRLQNGGELEAPDDEAHEEMQGSSGFTGMARPQQSEYHGETW